MEVLWLCVLAGTSGGMVAVTLYLLWLYCQQDEGMGGMEENWEKRATVNQSYDPSKKATKAPVLRSLQGAMPSQRKEFRAKEKVKIETSTAIRPGLLRRDIGADMMGPIRRPTIGGQSDGGSSRPGSVTSALLAADLGRGGGHPGQRVAGQLRRPGPGSVVGWGEDRGTDTNTTRDTVEMDNTRDTLESGANTTVDTLDPCLNQLVLGRGRGLLQQVPLRRPSGFGRM